MRPAHGERVRDPSDRPRSDLPLSCLLLITRVTADLCCDPGLRRRAIAGTMRSLVTADALATPPD